MEAVDLARLLEDRNRCAHPSMNSSDEIYSPSAELARSHLRHAVMHVLRHPPVQGKAALDRLIADVQSEYFPTTEEGAQAHFSRSPLARPRESLVGNFILVLLKTSLLETLPEAAFMRHMAALKAVRKMHPNSDRALTTELTRIARLVPDDRLGSIVAFLSYIDDSWRFFEEDVQGKLKRFTEQLSTEDLLRYLPFALTYGPLQEEAHRRLAATTITELTRLVRRSPQVEVVEHAIDTYVASPNYDTANTLGRSVMVPLTPYFTETHIERIVEAAGQNSQINGSLALENVLRALKSSEPIEPSAFSRLLVKAGLGKRFPWLIAAE